MCGVDFITFNVLLHTKSEQKVIGKCFVHLYFSKSVKNRFFNKKYTFTIYVERLWIVIGYFLFEKQAFDGLLKVMVYKDIYKDKSL